MGLASFKQVPASLVEHYVLASLENSVLASFRLTSASLVKNFSASLGQFWKLLRVLETFASFGKLLRVWKL